ncbi:hypothetical protein BASA81_008568 [Batrachochytrium salamandrivorans]|nr:hypothetical protein BASA81_008568 [Batrachochytrium salamandrivorans]
MLSGASHNCLLSPSSWGSFTERGHLNFDSVARGEKIWVHKKPTVGTTELHLLAHDEDIAHLTRWPAVPTPQPLDEEYELKEVFNNDTVGPPKARFQGGWLIFFSKSYKLSFNGDVIVQIGAQRSSFYHLKEGEVIDPKTVAKKNAKRQKLDAEEVVRQTEENRRVAVGVAAGVVAAAAAAPQAAPPLEVDEEEQDEA